jgi:hypothetical protein
LGQIKPFIPADFKVPNSLQNEHFRIRMLTVNDAVKDYDARITMWVRASVVNNGLDTILFDSVKKWISKDWPFRKVAYPGREINWTEWKSMN